MDQAGDDVSPDTPLLQGNNDDDVEEDGPARPCSSCAKTVLAFVLQPFNDDNDKASFTSLASSVVTLSLAGMILGGLSPKNHDLNGCWYPFVSASIGYAYFLMWSISFYPQVHVNYQRKTTQGLSRDFVCLNVMGFACYATYNMALYWNPTVRAEYQHRHGDDDTVVPVQSNDVAFALHALLLSSITLCQVLYYDGWKSALPSRIVGVGIVLILCVLAVLGILLDSHHFHALDLMYLLSYIKMGITLIKYTPQVVLNIQRRSTKGWSIWQILLDFGGGTLSDAQLMGDCANLHDWSGITGNIAKFTLGMVSIVFDIVFLVQHYCLYATPNDGDDDESDEQVPLQQQEENDQSDDPENGVEEENDNKED